MDNEWEGILVGNGASIAIWDHFRYKSLYETASSSQISHPLNREDIQLFTKLETENFEAVLSALTTARLVCDTLKYDTNEIRSRYSTIRRALIEAVKAVHVPFNRIPKETFDTIRSTLLRYMWVYSTNYDLLIYWSIMQDDGRGFKDFFWTHGNEFDLTNTDVYDNSTRLLFLHGALHLLYSSTGLTWKQVATPTRNLLELFGEPEIEDAVPLFITEGSPKDKLEAIYRSDYLSFAFRRFEQHAGPLVVFGHSLGESDKHLVDAMKSWGKRRIAISVLPTNSSDIISRKLFLHQHLPDADLVFFDASTHPLGSRKLKLPESAGTTW